MSISKGVNLLFLFPLKIHTIVYRYSNSLYMRLIQYYQSPPSRTATTNVRNSLFPEIKNIK